MLQYLGFLSYFHQRHTARVNRSAFPRFTSIYQILEKNNKKLCMTIFHADKHYLELYKRH